jgi:hypothetical protein
VREWLTIEYRERLLFAGYVLRVNVARKQRVGKLDFGRRAAVFVNVEHASDIRSVSRACLLGLIGMERKLGQMHAAGRGGKLRR